MTLAPLLSASPAIKLHAFAAMAAFALGVVQLSAPKGTRVHRTVGWLWVVLMLIVSISAFWIHELRLWGPWSPIHLWRSLPWQCCQSECCMRAGITSRGTASL